VPSKWLDAPQRRHLLYPKLTDLLIVKQNFRRGSVRKIANGIVSIIAPQRAAKWFWDYSSSIEDQEPVREFWDIPFVRLGRVAAVTGDSSVSQPAYVFEKLLGGKERSRALSVGCGSARVELEYARLGCFSEIVASDLSPESLAKAEALALEAGVRDRFSYRRQGIDETVACNERFDAILCFNCLHHFKNVAEIIAKFSNLITNDGLLIIDDYIGVRHHRYRPEKFLLMQGLLEIIPERYRRHYRHPSIKRRVLIPSPLMIYLRD
jgi:2-polyprenyl-3-methyl-5-hydroxy-6-metoxy-1,4-benzoquinol methylase